MISKTWQSLANKYRPQDFDNWMIGQKHIIPILKQNLKNKEKNINYILYGPRWTGKTSSARILAKWLNCLDLKDGNPCNQCINCNLIDENKSFDIIEIDAASNTGVDNIKEEIIEKSHYRPNGLIKKVYIIDEVHMLSKSAFNALLKTIEEPEDYISFILATTDIQKVPETIISRCQVFNFRTISLTDISDHLWWICDQENIKKEKNWLDMIAKLSDWCLRDAVKYLDQVSVLGDINESNVAEFLGVTPTHQIIEFVSMYRNLFENKNNIIDKNNDQNIKQIINFMENMNKSGINLEHFAKSIFLYCNDNFMSDCVFYSYLSEKFKNIYMNLKNYPNQILAYKVWLMDI